MYDMAKKAREEMKGKARRLAGEKDQKVDSSDWSPAEPLNADVKTGMRPISRRAYKKGGKVEGEACAPTHMGRKARKSGGKVSAKEMAEEKSEAKEYAKAKTNRDVKAANEEREGIKHVGGMKKGGRAKKMHGGTADKKPDAARDTSKDKLSFHEETGEPIYTRSDTGEHYKKGGRTKKMDGGQLDKMVSPEMRRRIEEGYKTPTQMPKNPPMPPRRPPETVGAKGTEPVGLDKDQIERLEKGRKHGGRSAHKDGGKIATTLAGQEKIQREQAAASKPHRGKAEHYKKGGRAEKMMGGMMADPRMDIVKKQAMNFGTGAQGTPYKKGGKAEDRVERKAGGRTKAKGKTNINIVIAAGKPAMSDAKQPPAGGPPMPPPGLPIPMGAGPQGGPPPGMPMPMPIPVPMAAGPQGAPPMPPMGRKTGGRTVAKSYKDMSAGAGSGEGRMQKTDIAKSGKGAPTYKTGGKVYRSYKDMDAGAGSGKGRLEKTEIEQRKH